MMNLDIRQVDIRLVDIQLVDIHQGQDRQMVDIPQEEDIQMEDTRLQEGTHPEEDSHQVEGTQVVHVLVEDIHILVEGMIHAVGSVQQHIQQVVKIALCH